MNGLKGSGENRAGSERDVDKSGTEWDQRPPHLQAEAVPSPGACCGTTRSPWLTQPKVPPRTPPHSPVQPTTDPQHKPEPPCADPSLTQALTPLFPRFLELGMISPRPPLAVLTSPGTTTELLPCATNPSYPPSSWVSAARTRPARAHINSLLKIPWAHSQSCADPPGPAPREQGWGGQGCEPLQPTSP